MSYDILRLQPFGVIVQSQSRRAPVREVPAQVLKRLAREHHLVLLRGFSGFDRSADFAGYCETLGEISVWPFGKVLELVEQADPKDHIFDSNYVPMHWDGMYRLQIPEFQVFHCARAPGKGQGGRTTFSNTRIALARASSETRARWASVTGVYRRKMEYYDSKTVAPIVTEHPVRGFPVIRYCEPPITGDATFVNHPDLAFEGLPASALPAFHRELRDALYAPEALYSHAWCEDDLVITDNYTLLHGREAFQSGSPRYLRRVHVLGEPALDNPHLVSHA